MPSTPLEPTAKSAGKAPVVAWLEMQGQSKPSAFALEKDMRLLVGTSSVCDARVSGTVEGIIASLTSRGDDVILRVVGDALPMRVDGRTVPAGEVLPLAETQEFYVGRTLFLYRRAVGLASRVAPTSLAPAAVRKGTEGRAASDETLELALRKDPIEVQRWVVRRLQKSLELGSLSVKELGSPDTRRRIALQLRVVIHELQRGGELALESSVLEKRVLDEVVGLGPLEDLLADPSVTEIMVNSPSQIFVERKGGLTLSEVIFSSEHALMAVIERIVSTVNRRIDASSPIVDARLLDGSRVNAVIPPIALKGPCLTIRRFSKTPIGVEKLVEWKSMTPFTSVFLRACVEARLNVVISGGTGSGKTTLLNALSGFIPAHERIVTIEDAAELQLQQPHVVSLEARPSNMEGRGSVSIRDLVKNCLRMRPDRIVVGECRGGEALDMLQAMNTGHDGSLTTGHANAPEDMLRRLETMVMMAGVDFPLKAIREQISSAVNLIVQQTRLYSGRRLVTAVTWIDDLDLTTNSYRTIPLVWFAQEEGSDQGELQYDPTAMRMLAKRFGFTRALDGLISAHEKELCAQEHCAEELRTQKEDAP